MSAKAFVLVGIAWFAVACLLFFFVLKRDFALFVGLGPRGMVALAVLTNVLVYIYWLILLGWTVPLAYGAYRIFKH